MHDGESNIFKVVERWTSTCFTSPWT